jgi:hypothetical protein
MQRHVMIDRTRADSTSAITGKDPGHGENTFPEISSGEGVNQQSVETGGAASRVS